MVDERPQREEEGGGHDDAVGLACGAVGDAADPPFGPAGRGERPRHAGDHRKHRHRDDHAVEDDADAGREEAELGEDGAKAVEDEHRHADVGDHHRRRHQHLPLRRRALGRGPGVGPADEEEADEDDDGGHRRGGEEEEEHLEVGARRDALEPGREDAGGSRGDGRDARRYVPPERRAEHALAAFEQPRGEEGVAAGRDRLEELAGLEDDDGGLPGKRGERLELGVELIVDLLRRRRERRRGLALRRRRGDRLHLRVEVGDARIDAGLEGAGRGSHRLHAVALFLEIGERQPVAAERRLGLRQRRPPAVDHLLIAGVVLRGREQPARRGRRGRARRSPRGTATGAAAQPCGV